MQLKPELQTMRKGGENIEKYLQCVKSARDQLLSVRVIIPDEDIIIVILNYVLRPQLLETREIVVVVVVVHLQ